MAKFWLHLASANGDVCSRLPVAVTKPAHLYLPTIFDALYQESWDSLPTPRVNDRDILTQSNGVTTEFDISECLAITFNTKFESLRLCPLHAGNLDLRRDNKWQSRKEQINKPVWKDLYLNIGVSLQLKLDFPCVWQATEQTGLLNCQLFNQFVRGAWTFLLLKSEFDYFRAALPFQLS